MSPRWMPSAVQAPAGAWRGSRRQFDGSILRKLLWLTLASMCSRRPSCAGIEQPAHLLHRRLVAAFVADAEHAAGLGAGRQNPLGAGGIERERLFAEHLLAGFEAGDRHLLMQQMRRHYCDGVDVGPLEQVLVVDNQIETVRGRERRDRVVIDVAAGNNFEARTFGEAGDDLLAPPAEPDNTDPDHSAYSLHGPSEQCVAGRECAMVGRFALPPRNISGEEQGAAKFGSRLCRCRIARPALFPA